MSKNGKYKYDTIEKRSYRHNPDSDSWNDEEYSLTHTTDDAVYCASMLYSQSEPDKIPNLYYYCVTEHIISMLAAYCNEDEAEDARILYYKSNTSNLKYHMEKLLDNYDYPSMYQIKEAVINAAYDEASKISEFYKNYIRKNKEESNPKQEPVETYSEYKTAPISYDYKLTEYQSNIDKSVDKYKPEPKPVKSINKEVQQANNYFSMIGTVICILVAHGSYLFCGTGYAGVIGLWCIIGHWFFTCFYIGDKTTLGFIYTILGSASFIISFGIMHDRICGPQILIGSFLFCLALASNFYKEELNMIFNEK